MMVYIIAQTVQYVHYNTVLGILAPYFEATSGNIVSRVIMQDKVINFLDKLSDEALKKEATTEAKSDTFSSIMKVTKHVSKLECIFHYCLTAPTVITPFVSACFHQRRH